MNGPAEYLAIAFASRDAVIAARLRVSVAELVPDARVVRSRTGIVAALRELATSVDARAHAEALRGRRWPEARRDRCAPRSPPGGAGGRHRPRHERRRRRHDVRGPRAVHVRAGTTRERHPRVRRPDPRTVGRRRAARRARAHPRRVPAPPRQPERRRPRPLSAPEHRAAALAAHHQAHRRRSEERRFTPRAAARAPRAERPRAARVVKQVPYAMIRLVGGVIATLWCIYVFSREGSVVTGFLGIALFTAGWFAAQRF